MEDIVNQASKVIFSKSIYELAFERIEELENELKLRVDSAKEFREHLRQCNGEMYRLKQIIKQQEKQIEQLKKGS